MKKPHKVKRYEYEWSGQRRQWWVRMAMTVVLLAIAGGIGWFAYDPVYNMVTGLGDRLTAAPESSSVAAPPPESQSASSQPAQVVTPPETDSSGWPEDIYYLPEAVVTNTATLTAELSKIKAAGGTGVVFDMKNEMGVVLYNSQLPEVAAAFSRSGTAYDLKAVADTIRQEGLKPIGRLFAFKDSTATSAATMSDAAVKYMDSKVNWLDNAKADGGKAWLNPNSPLAQEYILKMVEETAGLGIECILLDGVQFPVGLSLHLATYGGVPDRSAVLSDFLERATRIASEKGSSVATVLTADAVAGVNDIPYGDAPEKLAQSVDLTWLDVRPEQFGIGVISEELTLEKPLLTPYETVKAVLEASRTTLETEGLQLGVMVQCYTSTVVEGAANKTYGSQEIAQQKQAAGEENLTKTLYYNPGGSYPS